MVTEQMIFLSVNSTAERLRVSPRTVLNMIERGRFPGAYKIDPLAETSAWRIPVEAVEKFEELRKGPPGGAKSE